jgi:hypothetical protein
MEPLSSATMAPAKKTSHWQISLRALAALIAIIALVLAPISGRISKHREESKLLAKLSGRFALVGTVKSADLLDELLYFGGLQRTPEVTQLFAAPSTKHVCAEDIDAICQLRSLRRISLDNTDVADGDLLKLLEALPDLDRLFITETKVTKEGVDLAEPRFPNVDIVWVP